MSVSPATLASAIFNVLLRNVMFLLTASLRQLTFIGPTLAPPDFFNLEGSEVVFGTTLRVYPRRALLLAMESSGPFPSKILKA